MSQHRVILGVIIINSMYDLFSDVTYEVTYKHNKEVEQDDRHSVVGNLFRLYICYLHANRGANYDEY